MKLFGTDGVRGPANEGSMTPTSLVRLSQATATYFRTHHQSGDEDGHRFSVVIGKDTRLSGYMVEASLMAGFVSMGCDVILLGPVPTPAVAMLTPSLRAHLGVMISASHNPSMDNGIKLFHANGTKLLPDQESAIEHLYAQDGFQMAHGRDIGRAKRLDDALGRYIECVKATSPKRLNLHGMKIVVDCAHGAMYKAAPTILWELGAAVVALHCEPNGVNINEACGAGDTRALTQCVVQEQAHIGISLDGDGDRLVIVDETGHALDGDYILALLAYMRHQAQDPSIHAGGVVGTILSNGALERYLHNLGIPFYRAKVGDRHVYNMMVKQGASLGGEPSGHIILRDYCSTGDGMIATLQVLHFLITMQKRGDHQRKASCIRELFDLLPQHSINLPIDASRPFNFTTLAPIIQMAEQSLQKAGGRLVVRPSGTEPLLRLMAEGAQKELLQSVLKELAQQFKEVL